MLHAFDLSTDEARTSLALWHDRRRCRRYLLYLVPSIFLRKVSHILGQVVLVSPAMSAVKNKKVRVPHMSE